MATMNLTARKSDCDLQVLNAQMVQVAEFEGVIHLFEHDYAGFRFWHGVVDIADAAPAIAAFGAGEHQDIKIRVILPDGQAGLAKLFFFRTDQRPPIDQNILGVVGITQLRME